jgi:LysM repeat protein
MRLALHRLGAAALLGAAQVGWAGEVIHTVEAGETLPAAAVRFYGDARWADSIALYNGLEPPAAVSTGQTLRIPVAEMHEVSPGESWGTLAERYWGDASRHRELAELSGAPEPVLSPGAQVRIPALIPMRIHAGESLAAISRRIYGVPEHAAALGRLNQLARPELLAVGQRVTVTVLGLAPRFGEPARQTLEAGPLPSVGSSLGSKAAPPPEPDRRLTEAIEIYHAGRYDQALAALEALAADLHPGTVDERELLLRHLVFLYVAFERASPACDAFAALLRLRPGFAWDPDSVSPKVILLTSRCGG